jgi:hypothetical protein
MPRDLRDGKSPVVWITPAQLRQLAAGKTVRAAVESSDPHAGLTAIVRLLGGDR